jgi:hypothetical protein
VSKRKRIFRLAFYVLLLAAFPCRAQETYAPPRFLTQTIVDSPFKDTANYCACGPDNLAAASTRQPDVSVIEKYRGDKEFQYERTLKNEADSYWTNLINRIMRRLFGSEHEDSVRIRKILLWLVAASGVLIVCFWLYKSGFSGVPLRRSGRISDGSLIQETERDEEDIEKEIAAAMDAKNYALAIRWLFIRTIKRMAENGEIELRHDKTNKDYGYEIKDQGMQNNFRQLERIFEYTNYGHFETSQENYFQARDISGKINNRSGI